MSDLPDTSPENLLADFINSGRSEQSFALLVQKLSGLVYGSAYRRTGDHQLSEEITQNVFSALAHKAESLATHPSLSSWLYRTTRFEAENLRRKEIRYRRKLEKLSHETMSSPHDSPVLNRENLELLEKAIDRLGELDRTLLLARHFEGKSFQQIAAQTKRSEAACRVRLGRTLNKMAAFLTRRGLTLSIAALTSILGTELTRAAPSSIHITSAATSTSLSPAQTSSLLKLSPSSFFAMNIFKKIAILALALATTVGVHSLTQNTSEADPERKTNADFNNRASDRNLPLKTRLYSYFEDYPFASERLEELYLKYPNLRISPFSPPKSITLVEELNEWCEKNVELLEAARPPRSLLQQLGSTNSWNQDEALQFILKNQATLAKIQQLSELSTQPHERFGKVLDHIPEVINVQILSQLLNIAVKAHTLEEDPEKTAQALKSQRTFTKSLAQKSFKHAAIGARCEKKTKEVLLGLAQDGHVVPTFSPSSDFHMGEVFLDSLRMEVATMVSLLEHIHHAPDRSTIAPQLDFFFDYWADSYTDAMKLETFHAFLKADFRTLQDHYASVFSRGISLIEPIMKSGDWSSLNSLEEQLKPDEDLFFGENGTILKVIANHFKAIPYIPTQLIEHQLLDDQITALNALNRAEQDGMSYSSLEELVPAYLQRIPEHPASRIPFHLDPETEVLEITE